MRAHPMRLLTGLSALALLGATCHGTAPGGLDLSRHGLAPAAEAAARGAAATMPCAGGCGATLEACLARPAPCPQAPRALELAAALARAGATAAEIAAESQRYQGSLQQPPIELPVADSPCKGPEEAPVTVVVFSDFECLACAVARPLLDALAAPGGPVRLCFRYYPIDSHPHAREAAQAAEYARTQGRFWELHDRLFDRQDALSAQTLAALAEEVGLDSAAMLEALGSGRHLPIVEASKAQARQVGVSGTPTVFVNGHLFTLPLDGPFLQRAVEDHLERARAAPSP